MEQKTSKRRGRKPINIDYSQVEHLASLNLGIMSICRSIGVGWDTFDKHRKKKNSELSEALERGKAKGLQRATSKLMEKIEDGEFQAIQFYLKSADREKWAERAEINHSINLAHILEDAQARIIELPRAEAPHAPKVKRLENIKGKG
jgi:nucleotidyltransferase/DNA polymerase involved in DNA repair